MREHREWGAEKGMGLFSTEIEEHNATVRAYRDAMAECERLGKANDEACDRIAELERALSAATQECSRVRKEAIDTIKALESRPVLTWQECEAKLTEFWGPSAIERLSDWLKSRLPAPTDSIRVPFSDEQIEAMAKAFYNERWGHGEWDSESGSIKDRNRIAIRAALAAGGLEPCAVPEYAPEDVALRPERASDEELCDTTWDAMTGLYPFMKSRWQESSCLERGIVERLVRAVRARVEAPLLAEIERLEIECHDREFYVTEFSAVSQERDAIKARVAELEAMVNQTGADFELAVKSRDWQHEAHLACKKLSDDLCAELEAATKMRDELQEHLDNFLSRNYQGIIDENRALRSELAAFRQPVDPDAWKLSVGGMSFTTPHSASWVINVQPNAACATLTVCQDGVTRHCALSPSDAARAALWLASYAQAHGRAEMPSAEFVRDVIRKVVDGKGDVPKMELARAILSALRPWLRTPTGWELDVTAKDVYDYWADMEGTETAQGAIDFIKSRIRPAFGPCQECAELRERLARMIDTSATLHTHATEARAALEGK